MDQQELQKTIAKYYQKLPSKLQESFSSMNWIEIIKGIKEKNNLSEDQTQTLSIETTLLLLAIISKEEYEAILEKDLGLERSKLDLILKEIEAYILNNSGLLLRETFEKNQDESIIGEEIEKNTEIINDINKIAEEEKPKIIANEKESKVEKIVGELKHEEKVYEIGKANNLNISQITKLAEIVGDILNGKIFGDQFLNSLDSLNIDIEKKKNIAERINNEVFKEIRNRMMGKVEEVKNYEVHKAENEVKPNTEVGKVESKITDNKEKKSNTDANLISNKLFNSTKANIENSNHSLPEAKPVNPNSTPKIDPYREIPE